MTVKLNDKPCEVPEGTTLDIFVKSLGTPLQGVAIAIDHEVIPRSEWQNTMLTDDMALMLIQATSGG
jgi:sulfur carrier protein